MRTKIKEPTMYHLIKDGHEMGKKGKAIFISKEQVIEMYNDMIKDERVNGFIWYIEKEE